MDRSANMYGECFHPSGCTKDRNRGGGDIEVTIYSLSLVFPIGRFLFITCTPAYADLYF